MEPYTFHDGQRIAELNWKVIHSLTPKAFQEMLLNLECEIELRKAMTVTFVTNEK